MRTIPVADVVEAVAKAAIEAAYVLGDDVVRAITAARETETSAAGRDVLDQILENVSIAREGKFPLCQDTGLNILFVEMGEDVRVEGGLRAALEEGVRQGCQKGYLRRCICDPFSRENTGDNTPPIIHVNLIPGDGLVIDLLTKGGGAENMSRACVLPPAAGEEGVVDYAVETVSEGAVNACPPLVVGVGIGGDLERAAVIAKKTLTRPLGEAATDPQLAGIEAAVLERVNNLGIGPAGLGGKTTALAVHVAAEPCHIASLPVAVVLECHAHRHRRIVL